MFSAAVAHAELVKIVVPFAPGGAADLTARSLERVLTRRLPEHNFVVEYQAGAGGVIGANAVAKNKNKETVLMIHSLALIINSTNNNATYNLFQDFIPVATLGSLHLVLVTHKKSNTNTMSKLTSSKSPVFFGSSGVGTATHVAGELFGKQAKLDVVHVPYKGEGAALTDILSNNLNILFTGVGVIQSHSNSDVLQILAVSGTRRQPSLPGVPTLAEQGIQGFESSPNWLVLLANSTADAKILSLIQDAIAESLKNPEDADSFAKSGVDIERKNLFNTQQFLITEQQKIQKMLDKIKIGS